MNEQTLMLMREKELRKLVGEEIQRIIATESYLIS